MGMQYQITSKSRRLRHVMDMAVQFYAEELNLCANHFDLFVYALHGLTAEHEAYGMCQLDEPVNKRRQVTIFIDSSLKFGDFLQVLAHEMIHVKQMVKGQYWYFVDEYFGDTHFWMGKQVDVEYYERPWEKEAWAKQTPLALKFEKMFYESLENA